MTLIVTDLKVRVKGRLTVLNMYTTGCLKKRFFAMVDDRDHLLPAMEKFVSMEITKDISRPDVPVDEVDEELTSIEEKQVKLDAS